MFLLTTVFYIQTNEGAGRKIMRDGVLERGRRRRVREVQVMKETETVREGEPLAKNRLLKINTVI